MSKINDSFFGHNDRFEEYMKAQEEKRKREKEERIKMYKDRGIPQHIVDLLEKDFLNKDQKEFILRLPWESQSNKPIIDVNKAQTVLQSNHVGMEEVKKRIMDYVRSDFRRGAVLLSVGPPGVGKTSLANQIASAIEK